LIFIVIAFTYSRGALVALAAAIVVSLAFARERLRGRRWLALAGVAAGVPLAVGLTRDALTSPNVGLSQRQTTGAEFAAVILVTVVALIVGGRQVLLAEGRVTITPARRRGIVRGLIGLAALVVLVGVIAVALSHRGLTGTISHEWHNFTNTQALSETNPNRLLSDKFGYRLLWWKEALRAVSAKPVGGWGAGSFPVVHLLFRRNGLNVMQPHSVPLQFLAETGLVGAVLGIGAFVALLVAGARAVRATESPRERMLAAALLGAVVAYCLHAYYDWDSDIPGVTLPMLALLGVLVGSGAAHRQGRGAAHDGGGAPAAAYSHLPVGRVSPRLTGVGPGLRIAGVVALTLAMCAFAASAALPSIAGGKVDSAEVLAGNGNLKRAEQQAALAGKLDPLSDDGLWLQATIALRLARASGATNAARYFAQARTLIGDALARNPSDIKAWKTLTVVELLTHHLKGGIAAAQHILDLDPEGELNLLYAAGLAQGAQLLLAPPQDSAAATPTPQNPPPAGPPAG
jgi:O-antigen ligase